MRAVVVVLLIACGGSSPPPPKPAPPPPRADPWRGPQANVQEILARFNDFTREVCQCRDTDCALKVIEARNRYGAEQKRQNYDESSFTEQDMARARQVSTEFMDCAQRIIVPSEAAKASAAAYEEKVKKPLTELRDRMCACPDRACAQQVAHDFQRFVDDTASGFAPSETPESEALMKQLMTCELRVLQPKPQP